jgi:hypothetical protein
MVRGIIEANIPEDGGIECYEEIPFFYHAMFIVVLGAIHIFCSFKWKNHLNYQVK